MAEDSVSYRILTLNSISPKGLACFPAERFQVGPDVASPDAILVRSADMHRATVAPEVRAIGRAGAGTNNIPVEAMSRRGIPVFNAPGANANAVKELVLAGLLLAARNLAQAWLFTRGLQGDDAAIDAQVEQGKKALVGFELPGRTLGVVGLGAIGVEVANSALALGMRVLGYDPQITVQRAWQLSANAEQARSLEDLFARSDAVSVHVPLNETTRGLVNSTRLGLMKASGTVLNFARAGIVDEAAVLIALDAVRNGQGILVEPHDLNHAPGRTDRQPVIMNSVEPDEEVAGK
jgi:D-3-phosphoglycerate dehydrogenase